MFDVVTASDTRDQPKSDHHEEAEPQAKATGKKCRLQEELDFTEVNISEEIEGDSDELRSLCGSDEEVDQALVFNSETDFKKPISLVKGPKFNSRKVARKALRCHAIKNIYDFYILHNIKERISIYCKNRCDCP